MATVQDIFTEVRRTIHDEDSANYRWTDEELIDYLNAGQRQIVVLLPSANQVETIVDLGVAPFTARQSLPAGGIKFIRATSNYDDAGTTRQGPLRYVEKDALDTYEPTWEYVSTKADGDNYFEHYLHDKREPDVYYLYPVAAAVNKMVSILYSANPTEINVKWDTVSLSDEYTEALVTFVIYRALTKESRDALPSQYAQGLYGQFLTTLGLKPQVEEAVSAAENKPPEGD